MTDEQIAAKVKVEVSKRDLKAARDAAERLEAQQLRTLAEARRLVRECEYELDEAETELARLQD